LVLNRDAFRMKTDTATLKRVYAMSLAGVYPHYVAKAEKKGRTKAEVDEIIRWLTGYTQKQLEGILETRTSIETFISNAKMNPSRTLVTGVICGVRVEEIDDPVMQGIRYLDKLIDELAKGRPMAKILRGHEATLVSDQGTLAPASRATPSRSVRSSTAPKRRMNSPSRARPR
jgi:hypothetical protein